MSQLNNQSKEFNVKPGTKIAIAISRYNNDITNALLNSCQEYLLEKGVKTVDIQEAPGAFELPFVCQKLAETKSYAAVIGIGCIIRGETSHYDHIADAVANGMMQVGLTTKVPTIFGVLTVENLEQAKDRIKNGKRGDKGIEAAISALSLI